MSILYTFGFNFVTPTGPLTVNMTATGAQNLELDAIIAALANNYEIDDVGISVDDCQAFVFIATAAMTLKTNSSSMPGDEITLAANVPYFWITGNGTNPLQASITKLFVTSTPGGTLKIRALSNIATP